MQMYIRGIFYIHHKVKHALYIATLVSTMNTVDESEARDTLLASHSYILASYVADTSNYSAMSRLFIFGKV